MARKTKFVPDEFDVALADWLGSKMKLRRTSWEELQNATGIPERTLYRLFEPGAPMTLRRLMVITKALGTDVKAAADGAELLVEERRREAVRED